MKLELDTVWSAPEQGVLLLDAALCEQGFRELYSIFQDHQLDPLLFQTPYQALAELGPVIVSNQHIQTLLSYWQAHWQESVWLEHAVWLETTLSSDDVRKWLLARLQITSKSGLNYWMRWGDCRAISRTCLEHGHWPKAFWENIDKVRFFNQGQAESWQPVSVSSEVGSAEVFSSELIHCLAKSNPSL